MAYDTLATPNSELPVYRPLLILLGTTTFALAASHEQIVSFPLNGPTVPGMIARLSGTQAAAPEAAPLPVKRAIWAANQLRSKPYRMGGGHRTFRDNAYDCSGTVSYMLAGAGLIRAPMSSSEFRKFGERGHGKWITVFARNGHTFAIIAGLRLDTTPYVTGKERWAPRWQKSVRQASGFEARHPAGL